MIEVDTSEPADVLSVLLLALIEPKHKHALVILASHLEIAHSPFNLHHIWIVRELSVKLCNAVLLQVFQGIILTILLKFYDFKHFSGSEVRTSVVFAIEVAFEAQ